MQLIKKIKKWYREWFVMSVNNPHYTGIPVHQRVTNPSGLLDAVLVLVDKDSTNYYLYVLHKGREHYGRRYLLILIHCNPAKPQLYWKNDTIIVVDAKCGAIAESYGLEIRADGMQTEIHTRNIPHTCPG